MGQSKPTDERVDRRKPAQPRGRPRNDRLPEVLAHAAAMFSSNGYAATTLEDIGAQLGMTRPALYYYARSKEDLLEQCYDWTHQKFISRVGEAIASGTGRERLERFLLLYAETVCDDVGRCFLSSETHYLGPEAQETMRKRTHDVNSIALNLLEQGRADGSLAPCDPRYALTTVFGALNTLHALDRRKGETPRDMGRKVLDIILGGLAPR
jgi:AcrR family transcriptional regulator